MTVNISLECLFLLAANVSAGKDSGQQEWTFMGPALAHRVPDSCSPGLGQGAKGAKMLCPLLCTASELPTSS